MAVTILTSDPSVSDKPILDSDVLTLSEWLELISPHPDDREYCFVDYCFPTDLLRQEYLSGIGNRSEVEIKDLLRNLLILGGTLGCDHTAFQYWLQAGTLESVLDFEYVKRMLNPDRHTWEGNTWILDLLPLWPKKAVDALSAYIVAHCQFLPDGRWNGLEDAQAIIRARYLDVQHPQEVLMNISPREFELLVGHLYSKMGYAIEITPPVRDGGFDLRAERVHEGSIDRLLIECKRYSDHDVRVTHIRALAGVLDQHNATRGVLVTTSRFTRDATKQAHVTGRIELVDFPTLNRRLNEYLGPDWPHRIDKHLRDAERGLTPSKQLFSA